MYTEGDYLFLRYEDRLATIPAASCGMTSYAILGRIFGLWPETIKIDGKRWDQMHSGALGFGETCCALRCITRGAAVLHILMSLAMHFLQRMHRLEAYGDVAVGILNVFTPEQDQLGLYQDPECPAVVTGKPIGNIMRDVAGGAPSRTTV